jgi:hypothetical protein
MAETAARDRSAGSFRPPRWLIWLAGILVILLVVTFIVGKLLEERVRATIEGQMNERLEGYSVRLPAVDLHLWRFAISLLDLTIIQDAHPDPPVAHLPLFYASVHWRQILRGKLVADFFFDEPTVHLNLPQIRQEMEDEVPADERGWREALEAAYPLRFNLLRVRNGELTYIDADPDRPLNLSDIQLRIEDIRAVEDSDDPYPSPFFLDAVIFGQGHGTFEGHSDMLAEPHPGLLGQLRLENIPLDHFRPVFARGNFIVTAGVLAGDGELEWAPTARRLHVRKTNLTGVKMDYIVADEEDANGEEEENENEEGGEDGNSDGEANQGAGKVKAVTEGPDPGRLLLHIDELMADGEVGLVNEGTDPTYRIFLNEVELHLFNYSNDFLEGPADAHLQGLFMGSGQTLATATFRPQQQGPDFDLAVAIEETRLPAMNDLLRAYGNFDVVDGYFTFESELRIHDGHIEGYLRPFFGDMEVYDRRQDEDKGFLQQLYERVVGVIAGILENVPRDEVATEIEISGPLDDPDVSTWEIIVGLVRNAFFQAILPEFAEGLLD